MNASTDPAAGFGRLSRRRFFRWASSLTAALGVAPLVSSAETVASPLPDGEDYYAKLGVPTIINAAGTYTMFTAACMPPEVLAAVQKAALHPVRLHDLQRVHRATSEVRGSGRDFGSLGSHQPRHSRLHAAGEQH
jgi:hypothetical protein